MKKSLIMLISAVLAVVMMLSLSACAPAVEENDDDLVLGSPEDVVTPVTPDAPSAEDEVELVTPNVGTASGNEVTDEPTEAPLVDPTPATAGLKFRLTEGGESYYVFTYSGSETNVYIPYAYEGKPVVGIGYNAFNQSLIFSITLPDTIEYIEQYAFRETSLTTVHIPAGVSEIAELAFIDNSALATVTIDEDNANYRVVDNCLVKGDTIILGAKDSVIPTDPTVTAISNGAFRGTSIESVVIPSNIVTFGNGIFLGCKSLSTVTFYDGMVKIPDSMFFGCSSLSQIKLPTGITSIGARAFQECTSISAITIPAGVASVGQYAFEGCSKLSVVTIEEGVTTIGGAAFKNCSQLTSIVIPDSVVTLGAAVFWECRSLSSVSLGATSATRLSKLGGGAFYNCSALREVFIPKTVYELGAGLFYGCTYTEKNDAGEVLATFVVRCESSGYLKQDEWSAGATVLYSQQRT